MKEKKNIYKIKCLLINYKLYSFISLIILLYVFYDFVKAYLTQNTKTIKFDSSNTCRIDIFHFCNISDDIQFRSFILLALDGVSYQYIQPLLDYFGKNVH